MKARVLPDPVDAAMTKFSPFKSRGMTAFWTGVGVWKPEVVIPPIISQLVNGTVRSEIVVSL